MTQYYTSYLLWEDVPPEENPMGQPGYWYKEANTGPSVVDRGAPWRYSTKEDFDAYCAQYQAQYNDWQTAYDQALSDAMNTKINEIYGAAGSLEVPIEQFRQGLIGQVNNCLTVAEVNAIDVQNAAWPTVTPAPGS